MKFDESYLVVFKFLDYYYFNVNYNENKKGFLGAMVGAMAPDNELFEFIPDITFYNKWIDILECFWNINKSYLDCFIKYAEFYIKQYDFSFLLPVLDYLNTDLGRNKFLEIQQNVLN